MAVSIVRKPRLFRVSPEAVQHAKEIGIGGVRIKRLQRMAERSAPFTHPDGNRRFDDFVLLVRDKQIMGVNRL